MFLRIRGPLSIYLANRTNTRVAYIFGRFLDSLLVGSYILYRYIIREGPNPLGSRDIISTRLYYYKANS